MKFCTYSLSALTVLLMNFVLIDQVYSQSAKPLPLITADGRDVGLYRRLVSIPTAVLLDNADGVAVPSQPTPFSTFYIFDEQSVNGQQFIQVGPPGRAPTGWFKQADTLEWPNNVTLTPTVPSTRLLAPYVRSLPAITNLTADSDDFVDFIKQLGSASDELLVASSSSAAEAAEDKIAKLRAQGAVALESSTYRSWRDQFFLMPVLDFVEAQRNPITGEKGPTFFRTAVVPSRPDEVAAECAAPGNVGVVFVVDTTKSMQPYIDKTRDVLERLADDITSEIDPERVKFGLVGFRDDPVKRPDTEYRTRVFRTLDEDESPSTFPRTLSSMKATTQSTEGFSEDALAGVFEALEMDWDSFQSRWIVLVTDASPRFETTDKRGRLTNVADAASVLWDVNSTGLISIHLKTESARANGDIAVAERMLRQLSKWDNVDTPYVSIPDGDIDKFGSEIDTVIKTIIELANDNADLVPEDDSSDPLVRVGRAQKAIWLGKCDSEVPPVITGWITDRAQFDTSTSKKIRRKEPYAVQPRVLLTRIQLDLFRQSMQAVLDTYASVPEAGGEDFFDAISDSLINIMTDPSGLRTLDGSVEDYTPTRELSTLGDLLPSFLSLLPVKPDFFGLTREDWANATPDLRDNLVTGIRRRVNNLESLFDNPKAWVALHDDSSEYEYVTPVLIRLLP